MRRVGRSPFSALMPKTRLSPTGTASQFETGDRPIQLISQPDDRNQDNFSGSMSIEIANARAQGLCDLAAELLTPKVWQGQYAPITAERVGCAAWRRDRYEPWTRRMQ